MYGILPPADRREAISSHPPVRPKPSKTVQPPITSATPNSLRSPYFAQFAQSLGPENRGVGSSILPLTTTLDPGF
jgi:hypothetical protein